MGQDFTKGLNVCIGNYGYYNEGSLHDAWITLPKTEAEIRDFLHLNQLQDSQHEEIYISDYDGIPFGTRLLFNEFCHLEDLNLLAKQLVTANPADLEKVGAWIQANDTPESLVELMNLIEQADEIPFYSWGYDGAYDKDEFGSMIYTTMSPEKNYGYEMVEQNGELKHILDSSSQIESAFDYEKYGRAYTEGGEVTVLRDGYIDNCADGPDVDYYDRDELASLIGDRYDAKYPASSSKNHAHQSFLALRGCAQLQAVCYHPCRWQLFPSGFDRPFVQIRSPAGCPVHCISRCRERRRGRHRIPGDRASSGS